MNESKEHFEQLKFILENLRSPKRLDDHPWARSLTVQERAAQDASLAEKSPGARLALVLGDLFRQMMPATPPQKGKRLDTRWGRFGILAAHYFAPFLYGRIQPHSLRDAWRRIDSSILLFVYGLPANQLKPEQVEPYQLIGDELDFPANSTISDWHRNGLQDLAELFLNREKHLGLARGEASGVLDAGEGPAAPHLRPEPPAEKSAAPRVRRKLPKWIIFPILAALLLTLLLLVNEGWQVYKLAQAVQQDIASLEQLNPASLEDVGKLEEASALLDKTHADVEALRGRVSPWLGLTRRLGWVPVHGGDLVHLGDLLDMASALTSAAQKTFGTVYPIWQTIQDPSRTLKASELTAMLLDTRPELEQAQADLHQAIEARQRIEPAALSPEVRGMVDRVDPYLSLLDEALSVALAAPNLLGATEEGPKSYLILVQNEDELRPTGGFITSVGRVVVYQGQLVSWSVEDSYDVDDPDKTYPLAPWQLRSFMNIPVFVFRDSNWYTDYRTTALWAEYLYAYTNSPVDGVIAIDQHVLVSILSVTGPVYVEELDVTVTAENVRDTMRAQKIPPSEAEKGTEWHRKHFMKPIASAILGRLLAGQDISWESVLRTLVADLDERHILVQLDDPTLSNLLAERGWDGAIRPGAGDFLMAVDTNVGYNKTNAVVDSRLAYDINLTDAAAPVSNLVVSHSNHAQGEMGGHCDQRPAVSDVFSLEFWYAIDRCYYDYLRVYVPSGTQLADAAVHAVTREDMVMLEENVPARVDTLNELVEGVQGFGTLLVVPMGQSLETGLQFRLPAGILQPGPRTGQQVYRLKIQKQAGVVSMPVTVRVHLPTGAVIQSVSPQGMQDGSNVLFNLELREDIEIEIVFEL